MLKVLFLRAVTLTWHGDIMNKSHIVYECMYMIYLQGYPKILFTCKRYNVREPRPFRECSQI